MLQYVIILGLSNIVEPSKHFGEIREVGREEIFSFEEKM